MTETQKMSFETFKNKYNLKLSRQQEKAVTAGDGPALILAVPGSGKTTVLTDRLGYMILGKNIRPESVLAITFNRSAAEEIRRRFEETFGAGSSSGLSIQTINSMALAIYSRFCRETGHPYRELIGDEKRKLLLDVYRSRHEDSFPGESEISELEASITYIKNMCIDEEDIVDNFDDEEMTAMYRIYERRLKECGKMDFDDQMVFALWILEHRPAHLAYWQKRYRYICVDEAQDNSLIQHRIINKLAEGGNIFMVGDEDQSIYGFRGAYPEALLRFESNYRGAEIMKLETNYRSTKQIVSAAGRVIGRNKGRFEKNMKSFSGDGSAVRVIECDSRSEQFKKLADAAAENYRCGAFYGLTDEKQEETAFLCRDNESAIVLADLLMRKNIPFRYTGGNSSFFAAKSIRDYLAYLRLIVNNDDTEAFRQIGTKSGLMMKRDEVDFAAERCRRTGGNLFRMLRQRDAGASDKTETFITLIQNLKNADPATAISKVRSIVYSSFAEKYGQDDSRWETLRILAESEKTVEDFLSRVDFLRTFAEGGRRFSGESNIVLSTIHSSKGMEYDNVYIYDIFDGKFPSEISGVAVKSSIDEERRLFYVGITRAKRTLALMGIRGRKSAFLNDIIGTKRADAMKRSVNGLSAGKHPSDLIRRLHDMHNVK